MLKVNQKSPNFSLPSTTGSIFNLYKDVVNKPCILYFYPKDFTPGCTREALEFRDNLDFFTDHGVEVIGISRDPISVHNEFREKNGLPFHLLSDEGGLVAELYKADIPLIKFTRRVTYLLDKSHTIVTVYENLFAAPNHVHYMIQRIKDSFL